MRAILIGLGILSIFILSCATGAILWGLLWGWKMAPLGLLIAPSAAYILMGAYVIGKDFER